MLGIGGGAVFVPAIVIFGLAHVTPGEDPQKVAQGVSLVVIVCTGLVGTATNLRQGMVDLPTVSWLLPAAVAAAFVASLFANRLDADVLKRIYGVVALLLGLQMIAATLRSMLAPRTAAAAQRM
jgi:uncharacterized membrane protein YfcA